MNGLFSLRDWIALRRKVYLVVVLAGMCAMIGWLLQDADRMLATASLPAIHTAAKPTGTAAPQPLTSGKAMDGFGAWSPDGAQIAFMRDGRIWIMGADGKGARPLTQEAAMYDAVPTWRPDGKAVAFARISMEGDGAFVMAVDPVSGKAQILTKETAPVGHVSWDPQGKLLYYTTPQRLMRLDTSNGKAVQMHIVPDDWDMQAGGLAITPDGKQAIFGAGPKLGRMVQYDLQVISLAAPSQEREKLTTGGGIMPVLDPTGKLLAYRSPRQESGIYLMEMAKHATRLILADEGRALFFHPSFSPDGKRLLVSRLLLDSTGGGPDGSRLTSHLYVQAVPKN